MTEGIPAKPISRKLDLSPTPDKILRDFQKNADKMKHLLECKPKLDDIISTYKDANSPPFRSFSKAMFLLKNALNQRKFTLVPMIARFKGNSDQTHHLRRLLTYNKEIKTVFVEPAFEVEGTAYGYKLYIPIPINMLENEPKDLLKEHWNMVNETLTPNMRFKLIKRFNPQYTINRVYGWDAAYLAYEVAVIDDGNFWSLPLVNSPFNGIQPFVATEEGEFAILERDETELAKELTETIKSDIRKRTEGNPDIYFEVQESIEIPPELFAATIDYSDPQFNLKNVTKELGGKLGPISIDRSLPETTKQLFELMQAQVFGTPQHTFREEEKKGCRIRNK